MRGHGIIVHRPPLQALPARAEAVQGGQSTTLCMDRAAGQLGSSCQPSRVNVVALDLHSSRASRCADYWAAIQNAEQQGYHA